MLSRQASGHAVPSAAPRQYFILNAPRQTGKNAALRAIQDLIPSGAPGPSRCLYLNAEGGQTAPEDVACGMGAILKTLAERAFCTLGDQLADRAGDAIRVRSHAPTDGRAVATVCGGVQAVAGALGNNDQGRTGQSAAYIDRCSADERHLITFDHDNRLSDDRVVQRDEIVVSFLTHVWGM